MTINAFKVLLLTLKFSEGVRGAPIWPKKSLKWLKIETKITYTAKLLILDKSVYYNF